MDPKELLTWVQVYIFENLEHPTPEKIMQRFNLTEADFETLLPDLNKGLENRGHDPIKHLEKRLNPPVAPKAPGLDPFFVLAVDLLTDPLDKRSKSAKLKSAGISSLRFDKLMDKKDHRKYWDDKCKKMVAVAQTYGDVALVRNVENGDLQSIKYFYELTGKYRGQEETVTNLLILVSKMMEVLARYVDGPTLSRVAEEFDKIIDVEPTKELVSG